MRLALLIWVLAIGCSPAERADDDDDDSGDGGGVDAAVAPDGGGGGGPCSSDVDCGDGIACTIDHCTEEACEHVPCGDCCDEGLQCIVGYGCGTAPQPCTTDEECGDGTPCTLDRCRDETFCEHLPQEALCGVDELCLAALGCIPEPPSVCASDDECFGDRPCLGEWRCVDEFGCQFVAVLDCDDGDPCTADECDDARDGCVHDVPREECNARDDDCDDEIDEGFDCVFGESGPCATACGSTGTSTCGDDCVPGGCAPPEESCNDEDDDCDGKVDEGFQCTAGATSECPTECGSTGTRTCLADCSWDLCSPPDETCNGVDDDCDGGCDDGFTCCAGEVRDCALLGFDRGGALCADDCSRYDTSGCSTCGDGAIDQGEECDGGNLGGEDCTTIDGDYDSGTLSCGADCQFDTDGCDRWDASGFYTTDPDRSYQCADSIFGYLVDFAFDSCTFAAANGVLNVTCDTVPCPMSGFIDDQRDFDVSCTLQGTCDETYGLAGTFTDDDTWEATFTATFVGDCLDCVNQSWQETGSR